MKLKQLCLRGVVLAIVLNSFCWAGEVRVAAASDLQFAFQEVSNRFEKATGNQVKLSFGSSGNFFTQIQNGAPFDVFFSADLDYCKKLESLGLTTPGSLYEYAVGKIVLFAPADSKLDLNKGLGVLLDPAIHKIAIANPEHAPYGRAAVAALKHENLYDKVSPKFVLGENISQAATFVSSGAAEVGIVALSLALAPSMKDKAKYAEVPGENYPAIAQGAVILKSSPQQTTANQFLEFVKSPEILKLLQSYGFSTPKKSDVKPTEEKR